MGKSKDLATGNSAAYVETAGDTMAGNLGIGASPSIPLQVEKAGGGNFVASFQNTTSGTPYGVHIKDAASGANGYPLFQVTNSAGSTAHLKVMSGTGHVLMPNQPMFRVRCANNNNINGTVSGGVTLAGTGFYQSNTLVQAGSHFSISTGRFTAPVNGYYYLNFSNRIDNLDSGYAYFTIMDNGGSVITRNLTNVNTTYQTLHCSAVHYMSANDYVYVRYDASSDAYVNLDSDGFFSGFLIG